MRRPETITKRFVIRSFPLFWKKCCGCSTLFRFEFGYKVVWDIDHFGVHSKDNRYVCSSCAKSPNEAKRLFGGNGE